MIKNRRFECYENDQRITVKIELPFAHQYLMFTLIHGEKNFHLSPLSPFGNRIWNFRARTELQLKSAKLNIKKRKKKTATEFRTSVGIAWLL